MHCEAIMLKQSPDIDDRVHVRWLPLLYIGNELTLYFMVLQIELEESLANVCFLILCKLMKAVC